MCTKKPGPFDVLQFAVSASSDTFGALHFACAHIQESASASGMRVEFWPKTLCQSGLGIEAVAGGQ